jgi:excinuclease ABC subunit A
MGPGAGQLGGHVVAEGSVDKIKKSKESITGKYLSGRLKIEVPKSRRSWTDKISLKCANLNNLKKIDVEFPLGVLTCVTGVSGSGKSTLIKATLVPAIKNYLAKEKLKNIGCHSISGMDQITSVIELDQSPIGRTPKSNPATYSGAFDLIRTLYATSPDSKIKGYKSGRFSFNVKGGRCESCEGNGQKKIEMHFLPDVFIECEECKGKRYNSDTLNILFKTKNIFDVLKMTIDEGCLFFENHPKLGHILRTMRDVGLGYMQLGQPATTLSGGEAQRLKLASELARRPRGKCLYVLDEPTTGLHFEDINVLIKALNRLVDQGHSMIVIEHNLDVIKVSDYVIDLGPEGGTRGGVVVARGTPEEVAKVKSSFTGMFLKKYL